jgi:hypothetical protein
MPVLKLLPLLLDALIIGCVVARLDTIPTHTNPGVNIRGDGSAILNPCVATRFAPMSAVVARRSPLELYIPRKEPEEAPDPAVCTIAQTEPGIIVARIMTLERYTVPAVSTPVD